MSSLFLKRSSSSLLEKTSHLFPICVILGVVGCAFDAVLLIFQGVVIFKIDNLLRYVLYLITRKTENLGLDVVCREYFSVICDEILKLNLFQKKKDSVKLW